MARKKTLRSSLKPLTVKLKLFTRFDCPLCSRTDVVKCQIDKKKKKGIAICQVCKNSFTTSSNNLTKPVDVFNAWIDDIENL